MFATLVDTFKNFFSRAFWFGSFLPVLIAAAVHAFFAAMFANGFEGVRQWAQLVTAEKPGSLVLAFGCLIVIAYVFAPMTALFAGWLDGSRLPSWLYDRLRTFRKVTWRAKSNEILQTQRRVEEMKRLYAVGIPMLIRQRNAGITAARPDPLKIRAAKQEIQKLSTDADGMQFDISELSHAVTVLGDTLASNSAAASKELDRLHQQLLGILSEARSTFQHVAQASWRRNELVDPTNWEPSRVGDARVRSERYSSDAYGAEFDYLWPRLQLTLPDPGSGIALQLADARALVNFSVLLLVLCLTIPLVWLPIAFSTIRPLMFFCIGVGSVLAIAFLYELVIRSYLSFGEVVEAAIDRYRFDLLRLLHVKEPVNLLDERALWASLARAGNAGNAINIPYV